MQCCNACLLTVDSAVYIIDGIFVSAVTYSSVKLWWNHWNTRVLSSAVMLYFLFLQKSPIYFLCSHVPFTSSVICHLSYSCADMFHLLFLQYTNIFYPSSTCSAAMSRLLHLESCSSSSCVIMSRLVFLQYNNVFYPSSIGLISFLCWNVPSPYSAVMFRLLSLQQCFVSFLCSNVSSPFSLQ